MGKDRVGDCLDDILQPTTYDVFRQTKIALRVDNEEELDTLEAMARSLNLCARSIHDAYVTFILGLRKDVDTDPIYLHILQRPN